MPKTREQVAQAAREKALMRAIARCQFELGARSILKLSEFLHVPFSTLRLQMEGNCQSMKLRDFGEMARRLGLTGREVCDALGVPYEDRSEKNSVKGETTWCWRS